MSNPEPWSGPLPHPRERPWLPVPEAGWRLAGLGRSASFEAVRRGEIPSLRIGRKVVVPTTAIWALLSLDPDGASPSHRVEVDEPQVEGKGSVTVLQSKGRTAERRDRAT